MTVDGMGAHRFITDRLEWTNASSLKKSWTSPWAGGKVSDAGPKAEGSRPAVCVGLLHEITYGPPIGVMFGEGVPAQVSSSSSDHSPK
ncbi:hypothetical protein AVEN_224326-1 [Araneus ventricosus]|uniref:Uncharacterized protein n=1 Tax=Araneus ventricosus TaxID=182803 RepID=A0A4Y2QYA1_ARAVE|nr:hypothetical protein AVEN_224326-1 [Araneus ventricosus]